MLEGLLRVRVPEGDLDAASGRRRLTYSRRFLWTACLVSVVANGAFTLTTVLMKGDTPALVWGIGLFGLLWVAAMAAAWDAFVTKVSISDEGIHLQRGRSVVCIPWSGIATVRYSRLGSCFSFKAPGYPTVRVSIYRNGLGALSDCVKRKLPREGAAEAAELLREMALNP